LLYPENAEESLTHSRCSINICLLNGTK
jgi:hypothetical protein